MPRPAAAIGADGLPLWDTFEAVFFIVAGLSVGVVFGILFPSLWRSFRRRFRNPNRFAPDEKQLPFLIPSPFLNLNSDLTERNNSDFRPRTVSEAFVFARGVFQDGNSREAVQIYLEILGNEQVSKGQTNQALFELAQVYQSIGLQSRAIDTATELLFRKPDSAAVFSFLLELYQNNLAFEKLKGVLDIYQGPISDPLRLRTVHSLCFFGEKFLENGKETQALSEARLALHWQVLSGRAKILLWCITSDDLWKKSAPDTCGFWSALATDLEARLQIQLGSNISAAAGAKHLGKLLAFMSAAREPKNIFFTMKSEFRRITGLEKMNPNQIAKFEYLIFYAFVELVRDPRFLLDNALFEVLQCLISGQFLKLARSLQEFSNTPNLNVPLLQISILSHRCSACGSIFVEFNWVCASCKALESLFPLLPEEIFSTSELPAKF